MEKLHISFPVIVEGKYDRLRVLSVAKAQVLTTDGFGIFKKTEKAALFRALAAKNKLIVLTDPDGAGTLIRSHLTGLVPKDRIIPLYVPQIKGVEKRKKTPSAAGLLGVEGQERQVLYDLLAPFADDGAGEPWTLSKAAMFADGLTGTAGAAARRDRLAATFALPAGMTPNALAAALPLVASEAEYRAAVAAL